MKITRITCKQARLQIALLVGQDLDQDGQYELERHVVACPRCRERRSALREACSTLRQAGTELSEEAPTASLWPALERRIERYQAQRFPVRRSQWAPAVAIVAVCLLVAVISTRFPQHAMPTDFRAASESDHAVPVAPALDSASSELSDTADDSPDAFEDSEDLLRMREWPALPHSRSRRHDRPQVPIVPVNEWRSEGF